MEISTTLLKWWIQRTNFKGNYWKNVYTKNREDRWIIINKRQTKYWYYSFWFIKICRWISVGREERRRINSKKDPWIVVWI